MAISKKRKEEIERKKESLDYRELSQALCLAAKAVPRELIAKALGNKNSKTVDNIMIYFQPLLEELAVVADYSETRLQLLEAAESLALKSVVECLKQPQVQLRDAVIAFDKVSQHRRLCAGLSTSISQVNVKFTQVSLNNFSTQEPIDVTDETP